MIRVLLFFFSMLCINTSFSGVFERVFYFESNLDTLSRVEELRKFKKLKSLVQKFKIDSVFITGFADKDGNVKNNFNLSKRRALKILEKLSLPRKVFFEIEAKGDTFENYETDSVNKFKNRKVTIKIIHSGKKYKTFFYNGKKIKKGDKLDLPSVQFVPGKAILLPGSEVILDEMVAIMKVNPPLHFLVEGHVCCQHEVELSENRAKLVYSYLVEHGIDEKRLRYFGFGMSKLKYYQNDKRNRRVELKVLKI